MTTTFEDQQPRQPEEEPKKYIPTIAPELKPEKEKTGRSTRTKIGLALAGLAAAGTAVFGLNALGGGGHDGGPSVPSTSAPADPSDDEPWVQDVTVENVELIDGDTLSIGSKAFLEQHVVAVRNFPESPIPNSHDLLGDPVEPTNELNAATVLLSDNLNLALNVGTDQKTVDKYDKYLSTDGSKHGLAAFDQDFIEPIAPNLLLSSDSHDSSTLTGFIQAERQKKLAAAEAGTPYTSHIDVVSVNKMGNKEAAGLNVIADLDYTYGPKGQETTVHLKFGGLEYNNGGIWQFEQGSITVE